MAHSNKIVPGPPGHFLLGNTRDVRRDPLRFGLEMSQYYGDVVRIRLLCWPTYTWSTTQMASNGSSRTTSRTITKTCIPIRILKPFLGQGLVTNDGQSWLEQRHLMQPAFHRKRLAAFGTLMTDATVSMLDRWQRFAEREQPLDIAAEMLRLTLCIAGQALFSIDLSNESQSIGKAVASMNRLLTEYLSAPFLPISIPTLHNHRLQTARRALDRIVHEIIVQRRQQPADTGDVLSMLLFARDEETGQGMSEQQIRDEVMTLLIASHETVATALMWTWYLLSQHPQVEHRLHSELNELPGGQVPGMEHFNKLTYTRMVTQEVLRLYPPAWIFGRKTTADDEIGGYVIPANSIVVLSPYITHRHPVFWEHAEAFDPERFASGQAVGRPHYAYFPFGGGPRICIGNTFALMELQLVLATIAQRYQLRLVPSYQVEPEALLSLRPRAGLPMTLHRTSR